MHKIDTPTLEYAKRLGFDVIGWQPLLHAKDGRPHFNTTRFLLRGGKQLDVFAVKPIYYEALGGYWRPLSEICQYHGNRKIILNKNWRLATPRFIDWLSKRQRLLGSDLLLPTPFGDFAFQDLARPTINIGLTTTTVYPDPSPETTTVDGYARYNSTGVSWASIISANGGQFNDSAVDSVLWQISGSTGTGVSSTFDVLTRSFTLFDTSSIADSDSIDSGTMSLYCTSKLDEFSVDPTMGIMGATTASNTALASSDFQGTFSNQTLFATAKTHGSFTTSAYNDYTLNSSGLSAVSKTGVTKIGLRHAEDITGGTSPQQATSARDWNVVCSSADTTGTSQDPKLAIVHSASASSNTNWLLLF